MKNIQISIIIPVYNKEEYLEKCLRSIIENDVGSDIEVILIDDGSTDRSGELCDIYSDKYAYMYTYRTKNKGAAAARNYAMKKACGEYVLFVDADDYIDENSLKTILKEIQESKKDMYMLKAYKIYDGERKYALNTWNPFSINYTKAEWIKWCAQMPKYPGSACDKIIKLSFLKKNNILFDEGRTAEDLFWVLQNIIYAESYGIIEKDYYYYRQRIQNSVTDSISVKKVYDVRFAISQGILLARKKSEYAREIYSMMAYEIEVLLYLIGKIDKKERKDIKKFIENYFWILQYRNDKKTRIIRKITQICGIDICTDILKIYRKMIQK